MNKSCMLCFHKSTNGATPLSPLLKCITHHLTVLTSSLVSLNVQEVSNVSGCHFFSLMKFNGTFASHVHPCQTAPLLAFVTQQQNVMEYGWEDSATTAIPTSTSNSVVQHNKIAGVTFRSVLIIMICQARALHRSLHVVTKQNRKVVKSSF